MESWRSARLKERTVRMVKDLRQENPGDRTVISRVARQLGIGNESLGDWWGYRSFWSVPGWLRELPSTQFPLSPFNPSPL
jgi:hypothetical protein